MHEQFAGFGLSGESFNEEQVVDDVLPHDKHDFSIDLGITPTRILAFTPDQPRPAGIMVSKLRPERLETIPALAEVIRHQDPDRQNS